MIQRIEQYDDVLKVILKPTKSFPEGSNYFYTDASARELVERYNWGLFKNGSVVYVRACDGTERRVLFHNEYMKVLGYEFNIIDHENGLGTDNRSLNLRDCDTSRNNRNKLSKGYSCNNYNTFSVRLMVSGIYRSVYNAPNEYEAVKSVYRNRNKYYGDFTYNFLLDRRNDLDILDDELTGKITAEEATYRHVMRYAKDNAWYVYRYGLEEYFNSRGIPIPAFELDSQGYMVDPITGERLCPFK